MSVEAAAAPKAPIYRYVVVGLLVVTYTLNFLDRQLLATLTEPIRKDLNLTDTQMGMLGGIYFAAFYTAFGIPVGWLADRTKRIWIMAAACAMWSGFTMGCGRAMNFATLAVMRMGVGIGEAGGSPPSYSLISDYFPPKERGTGLAIYSLGVPLGSMLGTAVGGSIAADYGWRWAFIIIGAIGLPVALAMLLVIREPKRGGLDAYLEGKEAHEPPPPLLSAIASYFTNRTLLLTAVSSGLSAFVGYALLNWNTALLMRVKGMSLKEVAAYYAILVGVTGVIGTFTAGWMADVLSRRDRRWYAWIPAICFTLSIPFWFGIIWAPTWQLTLVFLAGPALLNNMYLAPALAVVQNAVPPARRTISGATLLFVLNLVGLGGGPVFLGKVSDMAKAQYGDHSLLVGYGAMIPIIVIVILSHLAAALSIGRDTRLAALK
jgi:MFS family permease